MRRSHARIVARAPGHFLAGAPTSRALPGCLSRPLGKTGQANPPEFMSVEQISPVEGESRPGARPVTAHAVRDGFELLLLRNATVELAVAPALGAKVISLKNLRSGRERLW